MKNVRETSSVFAKVSICQNGLYKTERWNIIQWRDGGQPQNNAITSHTSSLLNTHVLDVEEEQGGNNETDKNKT